MNYISYVSLIILVLSINGCLSDLQADATVSFEPTLSGVAPINGVLGNRKIEFFDNQLSFEKAASGYSADPTEQIDFSKNQVVLLDMGQKLTGGYSIRLDGIEEIAGVLRLNATEIIPGAGCVVTQALTAPYVFLRIINVVRVESIIIKSEVVDCNTP